MKTRNEIADAILTTAMDLLGSAVRLSPELIAEKIWLNSETGFGDKILDLEAREVVGWEEVLVLHKARWAVAFLVLADDGRVLRAEYAHDDKVVTNDTPENALVRVRRAARHVARSIRLAAQDSAQAEREAWGVLETRLCHL